ncbi:MFS transporter [Geobacter anodireducens]
MIRPAWLTRTSLSWALYDFANTIFSMSVVTLYFPLFLVQTLGYREYWLSLGLSLSMGLAAVASPFVGSASDRRIGKNVILAVATSLCCIATLLIPVPGHLAGVLAAFVAANFLYQVSLVAYDALLPSATDERHYGPVSGFGVALGYIGTFLALIIGKLLVTTPADNGRVFLPTAICFLLFALPCFFVKDLKRSQTSPVRVADTAREIIRDRDLRWYFAGHLLYLDAVNTVIAFMAVFLVKVGGFSQAKGEVNYFLMFSTIVRTAPGSTNRTPGDACPLDRRPRHGLPSLGQGTLLDPGPPFRHRSGWGLGVRPAAAAEHGPPGTGRELLRLLLPHRQVLVGGGSIAVRRHPRAPPRHRGDPLPARLLLAAYHGNRRHGLHRPHPPEAGHAAASGRRTVIPHACSKKE